MSDTVTITSVTEEIHLLENAASEIHLLENCVINLSSNGSGGLGNRQVLTYSPSNIYNLSGQPVDPARALFFVNGAKQVYGSDYTINSTVLTWVSSNLSLSVNDTIEIYY